MRASSPICPKSSIAPAATKLWKPKKLVLWIAIDLLISCWKEPFLAEGCSNPYSPSQYFYRTAISDCYKDCWLALLLSNCHSAATTYWFKYLSSCVTRLRSLDSASWNKHNFELCGLSNCYSSFEKFWFCFSECKSLSFWTSFKLLESCLVSSLILWSKD